MDGGQIGHGHDPFVTQPQGVTGGSDDHKWLVVRGGAGPRLPVEQAKSKKGGGLIPAPERDSNPGLRWLRAVSG